MREHDPEIRLFDGLCPHLVILNIAIRTSWRDGKERP